jgi:adenosylhomocysteine nucleosidase
MSRIAFVAALEREVRPLVKQWRVTSKEHSGRTYRFFEKEEAVLVCGGIGAEAARRAAEAVIVLYSPRIVYSAGYAGALDLGLKVGDIIYPSRVISAEDGSSVTLREGEGILVSSGTVASVVQKAKMRDAFQAQAVDMEAAAVARATQARGVEFSVVKAVSDEFDFDFPATERFVESNGQFRETAFALFVAARPWLWPCVMRLARNSNRATRALCEELRKIVGERTSNAKSLHAVDRR